MLLDQPFGFEESTSLVFVWMVRHDRQWLASADAHYSQLTQATDLPWLDEAAVALRVRAERAAETAPRPTERNDPDLRTIALGRVNWRQLARILFTPPPRAPIDAGSRS